MGGSHDSVDTAPLVSIPLQLGNVIFSALAIKLLSKEPPAWMPYSKEVTGQTFQKGILVKDRCPPTMSPEEKSTAWGNQGLHWESNRAL